MIIPCLHLLSCGDENTTQEDVRMAPLARLLTAALLLPLVSGRFAQAEEVTPSLWQPPCWGLLANADRPNPLDAQRDVVCFFLTGHFVPKGDELPGSAVDSVLLGVLKVDGADGRNPSRDGAWKAKHKQESDWGSLELEMKLENLDNPARDGLGDRWQTKKALQLDVAGPIFAFGEFNAGYNTLSAQEKKLGGGTGLGFKLAAWENVEVALKGGSQFNYTQDPLRPDRVQNDKSRLVLELECQYAIVGPLKLEYNGSAVPAFTPLEGNRISQDIRLLFPLGSLGEFRLGAKTNWSDQPSVRVAPDAHQIYLGVGLTR
jgi:hypothetical protein